MRGVGDALRASPAPVSLSSRCPERSFQIKAEREGGGFAWDTAPPRPCEPGDPIRAGLRCSSYTRTVLTARPQGPPVPRGSHGRGCFSSSEGPSRKPEVQSGHRCFCRGLNACLAVCCLRGRTMFPVIITIKQCGEGHEREPWWDQAAGRRGESCKAVLERGWGAAALSDSPGAPPPPPHGCFLHIITLPGPEVVPHPWRHQSEGTEL